MKELSKYKLSKLLNYILEGHSHELSCGFCPCCNGNCLEGCTNECYEIYKLASELLEYIEKKQG